MNFGIYDLFSLFGALGLFLYGMKVMSDSLMKLAGNQMRNILSRSTSNHFYAIFTGFFITAVIQSSSATTLMVVSFANASLLTLTESIGVIMGANIGTTVTAWLISILGFKVNMGAIALPVIGAGFIVSLSSDKYTKNWGKFLIGFALLFIGLQFLKESMPDIHSNPDAMMFLSEYTNKGAISVLLFLFVGTLLTVVIQSSSATMALTLVMCYQGWIPFELAAAMVLGENIGTTITANIASTVSNYKAKRAARAHFIFNIFGVIWILLIFPLFLSAIDFFIQLIEGLSPLTNVEAIPIGLALFHTCFNLLNIALLSLFVPLIVKIVSKMVPKKISKKREINKPQFLNKTSLKFPQTAIKALIDESLRLFKDSSCKVIAHGVNVHCSSLQSEQKLKKIVLTSELIKIDIDHVYYDKVKVIYSEILLYATKLQSNFALDKEKIIVIRNILLANRMLLEAVKDMKPLHQNLNKITSCDNIEIYKEYNRLRLIIMKILREIHAITESQQPLNHLNKLKKLKSKAKKLDVLLNDSISELLQERKIKKSMAISLLVDSANASKISKKLINIATLLFTQRDYILDELNSTNQNQVEVNNTDQAIKQEKVAMATEHDKGTQPKTKLN
jgi:phosphate:Na+ symporter